VTFTLSVQTADAVALPTDGSSASSTELGGVPQSPRDLNAFYYDVTGADQATGVAVAWNHPVSGSLVDGDFRPIATFTAVGSNQTWTTYTGLVRIQTPGRYYFLVYQPGGVAGSALTATSTLTPLMVTAITENMPTAPQPITAFHSCALSYDAGADPWQLFDATGTGTGAITTAWFDPAAAYGRLDTLALAGGGTKPPNAAPIFAHSFPATGGAIGRILLSDPSTSYFVKVSAQTATGTVVLSTAPRAITDLGTLTADGTTTTSTGHPLDMSANKAAYFLFRADAGDQLTVTTHPQGALDTQFRRVNADESMLGAIVNNPAGDDTASFTQPATGWTAVIVTAATPPTTPGQYDFSASASPPM
jgi:hypothetical protein